MLHLILMLNAMKILMKKILNSKLVIILGFQNTKHFAKGYTQNWSEEVFISLVKLKIQFRGHT